MSDGDVYTAALLNDHLDHASAVDGDDFYPLRGARKTVYYPGSGSTYYTLDGITGKVTTGSVASTVIQAALDGLTASRTWKEKVLVIGDITILTRLNIDSYTILELHGNLTADATLTTSHVFTNGTEQDIEICGGLWTGHSGETSCIALAFGADTLSNWYIHDVITTSADYGLHGTGNNQYGKVDNCEFRSHSQNGVDGQFDDTVFSNCTSRSNTGGGFCITASNRVSMFGCKALSNTTYGFSLETSLDTISLIGCEAKSNTTKGFTVAASNNAKTNILFMGCYAEANGQHGFSLAGDATGGNLTYPRVIGCHSKDNGTTTGTFQALRLIRCEEGIISGNILEETNAAGDRQTHGIYEANGDELLICDNRIIGSNWSTANVDLNGTNMIIRDNIGYVTENGGTATILNGNTSIVVAHGLSSTPTQFAVVGTTTDTEDCYVDTVGAANFTINVVGAVGANRDVYWRAWV